MREAVKGLAEIEENYSSAVPILHRKMPLTCDCKHGLLGGCPLAEAELGWRYENLLENVGHDGVMHYLLKGLRDQW